jgi:hypothetical protein
VTSYQLSEEEKSNLTSVTVICSEEHFPPSHYAMQEKKNKECVIKTRTQTSITAVCHCLRQIKQLAY